MIRKPPKFRFNPGDYVFINIPVIAKYEWHPFSISSAPEKSDFIWLHIRACGNWTKRLYSFASSPKFEMSNSFMQRSLTRINMRAHMCKASGLNETTGALMANSQLTRSQHRPIGSNPNLLSVNDNTCKKTVSFEKDQLNRLSEISRQMKENAGKQDGVQGASDEKDSAADAVTVAVKQPHQAKGILKVRALSLLIFARIFGII